MPQPQHQRGRRAKRKREAETVEEEEAVEPEKSAISAVETPFYGLLDDQEQEYFRQADNVLEADAFASNGAEGIDERRLFLENVYREANGKELKMACSQSCSRLFERLIVLSTTDQLAAIFEKFSSHFVTLVQHRFASHCCETLFRQAASLMQQGTDASALEMHFLHTLTELEPHLGFLMTDSFASHPFRLLLTIFAGMPLDAKQGNNVAVPASFEAALVQMLKQALAGLDSHQLQSLAMQPVANPVLQIVLEIELTRAGKEAAKNEQSLLRKLLPDDPANGDSQSAKFIEGLLYDRVGSRLLEVIVSHAPGKLFKGIFHGLWHDRLGILARNETAAFVVIRLIERLSKEDLEMAITSICPYVEDLIDRKRTIVIKALIDRSRVRQADLEPIATSLKGCKPLLALMTPEFEGVSAERQQIVVKDAAKVHASLLLQTMLEVPGSLRELVNAALLKLSAEQIAMLAKDRSASRCLQSSLTCSDQKQSFRRSFVSLFKGLLGNLAVDPVASHMVDALWAGTFDLKFLRERLAVELVASETALRDSYSGRVVWRNWKLDMFQAGKREWADEDAVKVRPKTAIELARERHAKTKSMSGR